MRNSVPKEETMKIFICVLVLMTSISTSANSISVNAGTFFQNCESLGTMAQISITGVEARRLYKTLGDATEIKFIYQSIIFRESNSIRCSKNSVSGKDHYRCSLNMSTTGEFDIQPLAPEQIPQQYPGQNYSTPSTHKVYSLEKSSEQPQQVQAQPQQKQCALRQIIID